MAAPRPKTTRGKGEGSVFKDERTGLWTSVFELGRVPDGERRRKYVRSKTKSETLRKMAKVGAEIDAGLPVADQNEERLKAGEAWQDDDFVFTTTIGTPIEPRNFERDWKRLCNDASAPAHKFHTTCHTAATTMLNAGVPLESITNVLGHSSVAVTADLYAQPSADTIRDAVLRGAKALNGERG